MIPLAKYEKIAHVIKLSDALLRSKDPALVAKKPELDTWIFKQAQLATIGKQALELLLKTTAIGLPIAAGGYFLINHLTNRLDDLANKTILKGALAATGVTTMGLAAHQAMRMLEKRSADIISHKTFKTLKKIAAAAAVDAILEDDAKYAELQQFNRAYVVHLLASLL